MMKFNAPKILIEWILNNNKLSNVVAEISIKYITNEGKKSVITLETKELLYSITLWDTGMLSLILMNALSLSETKSIDVECQSKEDILRNLDRFIKKL